MKEILLIFLAAVGSTCALVNFSNSTLINYYDALHYPVALDQCNFGCLIYAAGSSGYNNEYANSMDPYLDKVFVHDILTNYNIIRISTLAGQVDGGRRKVPLTIQGPAKLSIVDLNDSRASSPGFVIYVVDLATANAIGDFEVYDITDVRDAELKPQSEIITFISADPYTLNAPRSEEPNQVVVRLAGFDNAFANHRDGCPIALQSSDNSAFPGFSIQPNTPIISIVVSEKNRLILHPSANFEKNRELSSDGFITSPGWNGCRNPNSGGIQSFRSPKYMPSDSYTLSASSEVSIQMTVTPNLDHDHSLKIQQKGNQTIEISGTKVAEYDFVVADKSQSIDVWYENMVGDQGFLLSFTEILPKLISTSTAMPTAPVVITADAYCNCAITDGWFDHWDPSEIWVDVVFILDTSMGDKLEEAKTLVLSIVSLLSTDTSEEFYSRIGVIAASDAFEVIYALDMNATDNLDSVKQQNIDSIDIEAAFTAAIQLLEMGSNQSSYRPNVKQIVFYLTNSKPEKVHFDDIFKATGGIVIVNEFLQKGAVSNPGLKRIASDNYYFTDLTKNYLNSVSLLCEANCFCNSTKHAFNDDEISPRTQANRGCFHASDSGFPQSQASEICLREGAALVSIHDAQKEFFVNSVASEFGPKEKYWLGLTNNGTDWNWEDESDDPFSDWADNQPNTGGGTLMCAYATQATGLNVRWTAANCAMGGVIYVCESAPCSCGNKHC